MDKKRVCIIGNSHVAAWRVGLGSVSEWSARFETDFFAAQSDLMRSFELRGAVLCPTTEQVRRRVSLVSGGRGEINTADYSHFVLVGLGLNIVKPMEALQGFRVYRFDQGRQDASPYISGACLNALVDSVVRNSTAVYLARMLRKVTDAQLLMAPQPYPSVDVLRAPHWKRAKASGVLAHVEGLVREKSEQIAKEVSCTLLGQPAETLVDGLLTDARYSTDSIRLAAGMDTKHPKLEPFHMNAAYGARMLQNCMSHLAM